MTPSRVSRESLGKGYDVIVGFGHAAYGLITPDGDIVVFIGWWQSSVWTRSHMKVLRSIADEERSGKPEYMTDHLLVQNKTSDVPDVLPPSLVAFASDLLASQHGVPVT